jgi:HK97 gp10 family phage protein
MAVIYKSNLNNCIKFIDMKCQKNVERACKHLVTKIKLKLSQQGSGRIYKIRGVYHQASAPGEPPSPFTEQLKNSVKYTVKKTFGGIQGTVSVSGEEASYLEFGTSKMAPRPFFKQTYNEEEDTVKNILGGR